MTTQLNAEQKPAPLEAPGNATRTSDYEIRQEVWEAYVASFDRADDLAIALEVRGRGAALTDPVELDEFVRAQGHNPADFED
jgi:hypothetical protein